MPNLDIRFWDLSIGDIDEDTKIEDIYQELKERLIKELAVYSDEFLRPAKLMDMEET